VNPVIALWLQAWALVGRVAELGRYPLFQLEIINLLRYLIATFVGVLGKSGARKQFFMGIRTPESGIFPMVEFYSVFSGFVVIKPFRGN